MFFAFWFNVISYISKPIEILNKTIQKGDILFISGWRNTPTAKKTIYQYFNYFNNGRAVPISLPSLAKIQLEHLSFPYKIQTIQNEVTDIRILEAV